MHLHFFAFCVFQLNKRLFFPICFIIEDFFLSLKILIFFKSLKSSRSRDDDIVSYLVSSLGISASSHP